MSKPERAGAGARRSRGRPAAAAGGEGRVGGRMPREMILLSELLAVTAAPALAASGNGLYKPYPAATDPTAAQAYYAELGVALTNRQLRVGRFIGGLHAAAARGPSHRAGATAVGMGYGALIAVGAIALLAAGAVALRAPRPSPRTRAS